MAEGEDETGRGEASGGDGEGDVRGERGEERAFVRELAAALVVKGGRGGGDGEVRFGLGDGGLEKRPAQGITCNMDNSAANDIAAHLHLLGIRGLRLKPGLSIWALMNV